MDNRFDRKHRWRPISNLCKITMNYQIDFVFLLKAIKEKQNIDLHFKKNNKTFRFGSRFLKLCPDQNSICIECPSIRGIYHQVLKKNHSMSIIFHSSGFRLRFDSLVLENLCYNQKGEGTIPALNISWPEIIRDHNRRNVYRMAVATGESIKVRYTPLSIDWDNKPVRRHKNGHGSIEAVMIDISENGMALKIKTQKKIAVGDRILIDFFLGDEDPELIEFEGIIRNFRQIEGTQTCFCGIEFIREESKTYLNHFKKIAAYCLSVEKEKIDFHFVDKIVSRNFLVQKIVDGEVDSEVLDMLLKKRFTLTDEEYLEALVYVLKLEKYKNRARSFIKKIPDTVKEAYVKQKDANHRVVYFILLEALKNRNAQTILAIIENQYIPIKFFLKIAREGTNLLLGKLLNKKEKLIAYPEIMEVMEKNPQITLFQKKKIELIKAEYFKEFHEKEIPRDKVIREVKELAGTDTGITEKTRKKLSPENIKKKISITLDRINRMKLSHKIKLAFTGNIWERVILAKITEELITLALLENPRIEDGEILRILKDKKINERTIQKISNNPVWLKNRKICLHLIKSSKCPLDRAEEILNGFSVSVLQKLSGIKKLSKEMHALILDILKQKR